MKILIIGNIGSGKTTLGKEIHEITGFKFVQIDELREKYLNNSVSGEYYSLHKFLKEIEENENVILEFTGVGCHKYAIKKSLELSSDKIMIILCNTRNFDLILKRIDDKTFSYIHPFAVNPKEHSQYVNQESNQNLKDNFWNCKGFKFLEVFMDNENDLQLNIQKIREKLQL